jgi:hypothetical protein
MELWYADEFHLRYCLVGCPPHLLKRKDYKVQVLFGDMTDAELDLLENLWNQSMSK